MTAAVFQVVAFAVSAFVTVAGAVGVATTMSMFRSGIFLMASFVGAAALFLLLAADLLGLLQIMMYLGGMLVMVLFMVLFMHDPGGAMMASMEGLAPPERWFSRGLVPQTKDTGHGTAHGDHQGQGSEPGPHHAHHAEHRGHGSHQSHAGGQHQDQHQGAGSMGHGTGHGAAGGMGGGHQGGGMGMSDMSMVTPVRPFAAWLAAASGALLGAMLLLRPAWRTVAGLPEPDSARVIGELLMGKYMVAFEGAGLLILVGIFGAVLLARPAAFPDDPSRAGRVAVDAPPEPVAEEGLASAASHWDEENGA